MESILTPEQVADYLQLHHLTVLKLIKCGRLKGVKVGRIYRVPESSVDNFLQSSILTTS
jgi:excisionase family DNA binding protein